MSSGDVVVGARLLSVPGPDDLTEHPDDLSEHPDVAYPWDERVPPPGRDATLLAVVPIPGTGTSLAIVGYAIATTTDPHLTPDAGRKPKRAAARPRQKKNSGLRLDHVQRRVWADGREIELTFQEFELLAFLSAHPATIFTRADLVHQAWPHNPAQPRHPAQPHNPAADAKAIPPDSRTVDVHISRLRRKLGPRYGQALVTEYRVGYQFRPLGP